ncbi:hypothetical protein [Amycolatopsis panacis]|uniref:RNA polymerase subunit sigma-24 n=1 Tax=Amycolatopsis panacis TaxID=2340917 RepID=A0A419HN33_9PSEU|nr:hypothetical protein [Amycolatopsis panacis]RJQ77584.1 hypothetical protein D5S19_28760 [Amycolatopsis panacis]
MSVPAPAVRGEVVRPPGPHATCKGARQKYLLLVHASALEDNASPVGREPADWIAYDKEVRDAGVVVSGESLADLVTAEPLLRDYHPYAMARADLLERLGRRTEAADACRHALASARIEAERTFVHRRLTALDGPTTAR